MPTTTNGKICYIEMPARDVRVSAEFYQRSFGWRIRTRRDGSTAFDNTTAEVSGAFVLGRSPASTQEMLFYILVDSVPEAMEKVVANGSAIVEPIGADAPEITALQRSRWQCGRALSKPCVKQEEIRA